MRIDYLPRGGSLATAELLGDQDAAPIQLVKAASDARPLHETAEESEDRADRNLQRTETDL